MSRHKCRLIPLLLCVLLSYGGCDSIVMDVVKETDFCEDDSCRSGNMNANNVDPLHLALSDSSAFINAANHDVKPFGPATDPCIDDRWDNEVMVMVTFTNAVHNRELQNKFRLTVSSMIEHTTIFLVIHIIGDDGSFEVAKKIIHESVSEEKQKLYKVASLDVNAMAEKLDDIVRPMQKHFSYKPGAYYNHALFFLSIAIHRVLPTTVCRVVMLDADLKVVADMRDLVAQFNRFADDNIIGIARDMQPVYRHALWQYRRDNPGTRVGEPPPHGLTGFNSGVLLLNLHRMRASELYNSLLNAEAVGVLAGEFKFKGHLGDQDFFTLVSFRHENLFYVLPCSWNHQLCTWWGKHGYANVIDLYHRCDEPVNIYHGNCNTPIP